MITNRMTPVGLCDLREFLAGFAVKSFNAKGAKGSLRARSGGRVGVSKWRLAGEDARRSSDRSIADQGKLD